MSNNKPTLEFEKGKTYEVELMFDACLEGIGKNGKPYKIYSVKWNNTEYTFFANDYTLHNELSKYRRGDILKIVDESISDERFDNDFKVTSTASSRPLDEEISRANNNTQTKIETFAGMKIAASLPECDLGTLKDLTTEVLKIHAEIVDGK